MIAKEVQLSGRSSHHIEVRPGQLLSASIAALAALVILFGPSPVAMGASRSWQVAAGDWSVTNLQRPTLLAVVCQNSGESAGMRAQIQARIAIISAAENPPALLCMSAASSFRQYKRG